MARRKLDTQPDFLRALKNKYGLGEGDTYKPWLRVQDVSSRGNSGKIQGIKSHREHHTLSEHESCFFYLVEFCDTVIDIREQFPLLPLDLSVKISKTLNIKHPTVPNTKIPNVMTTDFVLTCSDGTRTWYEAITVKPTDQLKDKRIAEKLDIERIWWQLQGIRFQLFVMTDENKIQSKNIQWFTAQFRQGRRFPEELLNHALLFVHVGTALVEDICNDYISEMGIEHDDALVLLKSLMVHKLIEVDLNKPIADTGILEILKISNHQMVQNYAN
ncbi:MULTISPECIES: TnsA endonuclease N-terminal domain-containing protein [Yersinia]|uniref:Heteromeric transposase endonuclease subunit TnsA n=1 Tax=Yersinia rochesterensis TaxID=1604335 RepID=A0A8D4STP4_9GAMM|nr:MULTISPECIES: TnsA endonuclease N-terminal domain-containing protein [Yersinia]AYD45710.1 heteromeric transposase endonuclease subunit TnsA [Yersinia rochesterensis]CFR29113.1 TnsA endonuclease [Yersinia frederiksenii]